MARARYASGLLVGSPSVVRLPPSSVTIATTDRTETATQAPIVLHGWRALADASDWVESLLRIVVLLRAGDFDNGWRYPSHSAHPPV